MINLKLIVVNNGLQFLNEVENIVRNDNFLLPEVCSSSDGTYRLIYLLKHDFEDRIMFTGVLRQDRKQEKLKEFEDVEKKATAIYHTVLEHLINNKCENNYPAVIKKILDYIHNNHEKDISLGQIAEYVNLNASYVSTLFKKVRGVSFKNYLNSYRIKKIKELLISNPDKTIYEIAQLSGYENQRQFFRIFKMFTGMTPRQFRELFGKHIEGQI